jgi:hypothetical protein
MPTPTQAAIRPLHVTSDPARIRKTLRLLREAYAEVSLGDFISHDETFIRRERRACRRTKLQVPVMMTPADWSTEEDDALIVCGPEQIGVTGDISPTGMGLLHDQVLSSDVVIVQLDLPDIGPQYLALDLRWTVRQTKYSYLSGGRIVGFVDSLQ